MKKQVDENTYAFDYIIYYGLDRVPEQGEGISVVVLDSSWFHPDKHGIFGKMAPQVDGNGESAREYSHFNFHGIMVATLINGQPRPDIFFYGGTAPKALVHLIDIRDMHDYFDIPTLFSTAAQRGHIIVRSGNFQQKQGGKGWTEEDSERVYRILDAQDAILIITAGNDAYYQDGIGMTEETQWMHKLVKHPKLMSRVLVVANFEPLGEYEASVGMRMMRARELVGQYPGQPEDPVDMGIVEEMLVKVMSRPIARMFIRMKLKYIDNVRQLNDRLRSRPHFCKKGRIVSYTAGIMRNHCVFVAGCDIYTIGQFGEMRSNDGSSEAAPIMAGMFARFVQQRKTDENTYGDLLELFKTHYCEPLGEDQNIWGLGAPSTKFLN